MIVIGKKVKRKGVESVIIFNCLVWVMVEGKKDLYLIKWLKYPYMKVIY